LKVLLDDKEQRFTDLMDEQEDLKQHAERSKVQTQELEDQVRNIVVEYCKNLTF
jgi:hypothetical protein